MTRPKATPEASCTEMLRCAPAAAIGWKVNVILVGVASTLAAILGLVKWTVDRVDQIEARAVDAAEVRASKVAASAIDALRADLADDRKTAIRELLAEQAKSLRPIATAQR